MMLPAASIQQATLPAVQLLILNVLSNVTTFHELQNNITFCDVEQFKLQNNIISNLVQSQRQSVFEKQELEYKLIKMTEKSEDLINELTRRNLDLIEQMDKLKKEKQLYQSQLGDSRSRLYSISQQAETMKTTLDALGKQLDFITDETGKRVLHPINKGFENPPQNSYIREDSVQQTVIAESNSITADDQDHTINVNDQEHEINTDDKNFIVIPEDTMHYHSNWNDISELTKLSLPIANNKIKHYETELDFKMGAGCKIILTGIVENGSTIQFTEVGEDFEKEFGFIFNLENNIVHNYFESTFIHVTGKRPYKLEEGKVSTIIIQFTEQEELEMCIDDIGNCERFVIPISGRFFNKIKISDVELHDISFYVTEENKRTYINKTLNCVANQCDLRDVPKIGTIFSFTAKMPNSDYWVPEHFRIDYSRIPIHLSIRRNVGLGETVFNHMENCDWNIGQEEREYWFPFKKGKTYILTFNIQKTGTTISVDGVFFHYFRHRIEVEPVTVFEYEYEMIEASYSMIANTEEN